MHGSTLDENPESPLIFQETQGRKWSRNILLEGQEMASRQYCKPSIRLTNMKEYPNTKEYMRRTVNSCEKQENPGREEVVSASSYCFLFFEQLYDIYINNKKVGIYLQFFIWRRVPF